MTIHGNKILVTTAGKVGDKLVKEMDPKVVKRLTPAREFLAGLSPAEIENKHCWHKQTVYRWLNHFNQNGLKAEIDNFRENC